jgi:bacterioferritin
MRGSSKVIEELNKALREELTAINQYFLHAEMCENWGYEKLSEYIKKQSIGEMKHAEALMERILFLDGSPTMKPLELTVGKDVREMLQNDLPLERRERLQRGDSGCGGRKRQWVTRYVRHTVEGRGRSR